MGCVLHGCARTTPRVRAELQASKDSTRALAARYGLSPKTIAKWRKRTTTQDAPMGPRVRRSAGLTEDEERSVVDLRRATTLSLDDLLGRLRASLPKLSRSALHRCLQRHGVSRLPKPEGMARRGRFSETEIGYLHVDATEMRTAEGKAQVFLAVGRVSKLAHVELRESVTMQDGAEFMAGASKAFPYRVHTALTDNGAALTDQPRYRSGPAARFRVHVFDRVCLANGIAHRLTKPYHPWTNGQAERMARTLKEATVKSFHYETRADLEARLAAFVAARNFGKHLKALRWRTPFQVVCDAWRKEPARFKGDPYHLFPGLYT